MFQRNNSLLSLSCSLHEINDIDDQALTEAIKDVIERLQLDIKSMQIEDLEDVVSDDLKIPITNFCISRRIKAVIFELRKQRGVKLMLSLRGTQSMPQIFPAEQPATRAPPTPQTAPADSQMLPVHKRPKHDTSSLRMSRVPMSIKASVSAHRPFMRPAFYADVRDLFVKEMGSLLSGYTEDRLREEWANTDCNAMLEHSDYDIDQCPCIKRLSVFLRIYHDFYKHVGAEDLPPHVMFLFLPFSIHIITKFF